MVLEGSSHQLCYYLGICVEGLRKIMKTSFGIGIAGVLVEIETEHLTNTRLEHYS
jgi:hypothetical protein